jgi:type II secretory pathway component GspD/PulD (secretin)
MNDTQKFKMEVKSIKNSVKDINTKQFNMYKKTNDYSLIFDTDFNFIKIVKSFEHYNNSIQVNLYEYTSKQDVVDELLKYTQI